MIKSHNAILQNIRYLNLTFCTENDILEIYYYFTKKYKKNYINTTYSKINVIFIIVTKIKHFITINANINFNK